MTVSKWSWDFGISQISIGTNIYGILILMFFLQLSNENKIKVWPHSAYYKNQEAKKEVHESLNSDFV